MKHIQVPSQNEYTDIIEALLLKHLLVSNAYKGAEPLTIWRDAKWIADLLPSKFKIKAIMNHLTWLDPHNPIALSIDQLIKERTK